MSKRTARILIGIALLLALLIVTIPWLTGAFAEDQYAIFHQNLETEQNVAIQRQNYSKGWWHSKADSVFTLPGIADNLTLTHDVSHGLLPVVPVSAQSTINADGAVRAYADKLFGPTGSLIFETSLGATGSGHTEFRLLTDIEEEAHQLDGVIDFSNGYVKGDFFSRHIQWGETLNLEQIDLDVKFEQSGQDSQLKNGVTGNGSKHSISG